MFELNQLEQLIAIAECQTISAAAERLHLSQPALSRSIQKLEAALLQGMKDGTYQLVILPCPAEESALCCTAFESEQLYFALPPEHPLASAKGLHFKDLDGQAILMFSEIGFWKKVQQEMMPKTHTLIQENRADFETLVKTSVLPSFASDLAVRQSGRQNERVLVPILDKEASVTYFLVWKKEESKRWRALLEKIGERTARLKQA